ncbi:Beta-lactamase domain-containing protein [Trichostrongylus colubriformis]|uniref:Beta-lactamase domain-containing protein n=1 Tax=Trichostrongylus colubriformis TaxID=6319 RepID=A0AAN8EUZ6_TRICO
MICEVLSAIAILAALWWSFSRKQLKTVHGNVQPGFEAVQRKFSAMVQQDNEGAALAVLHRGQVVVHLFGGYANREKNQSWNEDTMAVAYSTTKIWAGLTSAILAGRGLLNYDEKVSTFWPEFTENGKGDATVRDILDHRAGLITFGREFGLEEANDLDAMSTLIEAATPHWSPGSCRGYHALTYGFLVDQVIRRLHPKGYTIQQIYQEEIWEQGIDFSIGSGNLDERRIAHIANPSVLQSIIAHARKPLKFLNALKCHFSRGGLDLMSASYPYFLGIMRMDSMPYNDPAVRRLPSLSCLGIGTAVGFAKAIHQVFKKHMIPDSVWKILSEPTATEEDIVLAEEKSFGHGFIYARHPVRKEDWIIRIIGNGLQIVEMDVQDEVITVMLRNGLRAGEDGLEEFEDMSKTIFQLVRDRKCVSQE